jgi:hypothetical protein
MPPAARQTAVPYEVLLCRVLQSPCLTTMLLLLPSPPLLLL